MRSTPARLRETGAGWDRYRQGGARRAGGAARRRRHALCSSTSRPPCSSTCRPVWTPTRCRRRPRPSAACSPTAGRSCRWRPGPPGEIGLQHGLGTAGHEGLGRSRGRRPRGVVRRRRSTPSAGSCSGPMPPLPSRRCAGSSRAAARPLPRPHAPPLAGGRAHPLNHSAVDRSGPRRTVASIRGSASTPTTDPPGGAGCRPSPTWPRARGGPRHRVAGAQRQPQGAAPRRGPGCSPPSRSSTTAPTRWPGACPSVAARPFGVVVPFFTHASAVERLRGVVAALDESRYDLVLFNVESPVHRDEHLGSLTRRGPGRRAADHVAPDAAPRPRAPDRRPACRSCWSTPRATA